MRACEGCARVGRGREEGEKEEWPAAGGKKLKYCEFGYSEHTSVTGVKFWCLWSYRLPNSVQQRKRYRDFREGGAAATAAPKKKKELASFSLKKYILYSVSKLSEKLLHELAGYSICKQAEHDFVTARDRVSAQQMAKKRCVGRVSVKKIVKKDA